MILGIGIDIIDINRIDKTLKRFGNRFINKCYSSKEINKSKEILNKSNYFAKKYAAKEACSKALGTGLSKGIFWKDIEIDNNHDGKPKINLYNNAIKRINIMTNKNYKIDISISDEKKYAIANVIISEV